MARVEYYKFRLLSTEYVDENVAEEAIDDNFCRVCGCSYFTPCANGCYWVENDLCSECTKVH